MKAIIFDMDGVIFDSERATLAEWLPLGEKYHIPDLDIMCRKIMGVNYEKGKQIFLDHYGADFPYDQYVAERRKSFHAKYDGGRLPLKSGVREALSRLKAEGFRLAIASSTRSDTVERELTEAGLRPFFDRVICGDMVARSKPEPDIFLKAGEGWGDAGSIFVVEDSFNGIRAARAAGMRPLMVPDLVQPDEEIRSLSEAVCGDLSDMIRHLEKQGVLDGKDRERFPDGTPIDPWFYDHGVPAPPSLGKIWDLRALGVPEDGGVHTAEIQAIIDRAAAEGGGVLTVPPGVWKTGALFFRQGVHLWVQEGATLLGSDDISDYPLMESRIEGQSCLYFSALINARGLKGFTMTGPGAIDGNGLRSWKSFWLRRKWNPDCTNKDEQRARLVFLQDCEDVRVAHLTLRNSQFWTNHLYRCRRVRYLGNRITSPHAPVAAPSTDALDLDVCEDVLVRDCYIDVNDDAVVLKGGKGPWADTAPENGANERILVEDCQYNFSHGCLTCGSESIHNRNILLRRIQVASCYNMFWLKLRPDTAQHYEYILAEDIRGSVDTFMTIHPWTQFFDLQGRTDLPKSRADHITVRRCQIECGTAFHVTPDEDHYLLSGFTLEDLDLKCGEPGLDMSTLPDSRLSRVRITRVEELKGTPVRSGPV